MTALKSFKQIRKEEQVEIDGMGIVTMRPLSVRQVMDISKVAKDQDSSIALGMLLRYVLVDPPMSEIDVQEFLDSAVSAGALNFIQRATEISGLGETAENLRRRFPTGEGGPTGERG